MAKIIPSMAVKQSKTEDALRRRIDELEAEVTRYKAALAAAQASSPAPVSARRASLITSPSTASYMRPTVSSALKTATDQTDEVPELPQHKDGGQSRYYEDGRLVRVGKKPDEAEPHYLAPTWATTYKSRKSSSWGWSYGFPPPNERKTLWEDEHAEEERAASPNPVELVCGRCNEIEEAMQDTGTESLASRSRLEDMEFHDSPLARLFIPHRILSRVLNSGLRLAQDIIWNAMRTHWPLEQTRRWVESPRQVRLGRSELQEVFGGEEVPRSRYNELCAGPHWMVNGAILALPDLRNVVAHQNGVTLNVADRLLKDVQDLAVLVQDERRAFKVRQLRDTLVSEAQKALAEIETVYSLFWDPINSSRQWKIHHQRTFEDVVWCSRSPGQESQKQYRAYPDIVKHAAWEWYHRCGAAAPGECNAEYLALVQKAKGYMRETATGQRHGSVSGGLATLTFKPVKEGEHDWILNPKLPVLEAADPHGWGGVSAQPDSSGDGEHTEPKTYGWPE